MEKQELLDKHHNLFNKISILFNKIVNSRDMSIPQSSLYYLETNNIPKDADLKKVLKGYHFEHWTGCLMKIKRFPLSIPSTSNTRIFIGQDIAKIGLSEEDLLRYINSVKKVSSVFDDIKPIGVINDRFYAEITNKHPYGSRRRLILIYPIRTIFQQYYGADYVQRYLNMLDQGLKDEEAFTLSLFLNDKNSSYTYNSGFGNLRYYIEPHSAGNVSFRQLSRPIEKNVIFSIKNRRFNDSINEFINPQTFFTSTVTSEKLEHISPELSTFHIKVFEKVYLFFESLFEKENYKEAVKYYNEINDLYSLELIISPRKIKNMFSFYKFLIRNNLEKENTTYNSFLVKMNLKYGIGKNGIISEPSSLIKKNSTTRGVYHYYFPDLFTPTKRNKKIPDYLLTKY